MNSHRKPWIWTPCALGLPEVGELVLMAGAFERAVVGYVRPTLTSDIPQFFTYHDDLWVTGVTKWCYVDEDNNGQLDELALVCRRLVRALKNTDPNNEIAGQAMDYLERSGLCGHVLRKVDE